jgi:integrase
MDDLVLIPPSGLPDAEVRHYLTQALSDNTRRAYRTDMDHYRAWGGMIPADPESIAHYLSVHAECLACATLQRRLVAIGKAHTVQGFSDPTKTEIVKLTLRGIRRVHGKPQTQVSPILKDDLIVMLSHTPDTTKGKRDRALLMLGFCGALRRSELVAVQMEDLEFSSQGIVLTLPRSKTDQTGQGRKIGIPRGRGRLCPVQSVNDWLTHSGAERGPVFRGVSKGGVISADSLSDRAVADIVKNYAEKAGLDPARYSGHSLRAGLATSAAQNGVSSWKIRQQTGHRSEMMLSRYIREGDLFTGNAAALF